MDTPPPTSLAQQLLTESGLDSSHVPIDEGLLLTLLDRHYRLGGRLRPVATEKDDTFRLRTGSGEYLVKVSHPDEGQDVVGLQTAAMRFLEDTAPELPVQRVRLTIGGQDSVVLGAETGRARVLRVFDFVPGAVWAEVATTAEQVAKVGAMLGRIDVALEAFTHPQDRRELTWNLQHFHELRELTEHTADARHRQLADEVLRLFEQRVVPKLAELETQVIHGDYSPYNVVIDENVDGYVTGVIDFGDTMRSALIFDPAVALANLLGRSPDRPWQEACAFVTGYERTRPIKDEELPLLPIAALARLTLRALLANWRAKRVPERRDYLLAHAKDDWVNVERSLAVPLTDVVEQLRTDEDGNHSAGGPGSVGS